MSTHDTLTQAIVAAHPGLAITADATRPAVFSSDAPVYRAAKQACLALGFVEADAECVANAWQSMSQRTGRFNAQAWPDQPEDFGLRPWPRTDAFAACPRKLGLYAVLPDAAWVARMARAGVPTVQLRFKSDDRAAIEREVHAAVDAVESTGALLFINDHWQAAIAAGAYGVHLGQEDLDTADLEKIRAAGLRLGLSSHGYAEMLRADRFSPSYLAMGAVFPTTLKRMVTAPQGTGRLGAYARLMRDYPLVAIGGIDSSRLPEVLASGVGSVAVVRALVAAEHPEQMAASLQARISAEA
ncbi:MAG: thiamine phosphate synthase [Rhodoferax sp.]|uniref:thiamine phosphate synthase n=1 Tax=Rhodoferax sp. TaxID=50421 RepID=UPI0027174768|nr:thiamine phosphate synthase [Rhodoferax sp.]MDO8451015.1 thiamine phosphate synthase [Rhodoferax sp.]